LHTLRVLLLISAERWKDAAARSEELLRLDPAAADSAFFVRLSVAYRNDSQPDKSTATLKRATEKFPRNAFFRLLHGQELGRLGKTQEAIAEYKAALEIDPKLPNVRTFVASAYQQLNAPDSTLAWLRLAYAAKEDTATIAGMARSIGGRYLQAAQQTKTIEDYRKVIPSIAFSDTVSASNEAKWWWSLAEFAIGAQMASKLQAEPSCELARESIKSLEQVPALFRAGGGRVDMQNAGQIMVSLNELQPYVNAKINELCRSTQ